MRGNSCFKAIILKTFLLNSVKFLMLVNFLISGYTGNTQSGLITRQGKTLFRNGTPYKFVGFNAFTLTGCGNTPDDEELNAYFASLRPGSLTRIWGFQVLQSGIERVVKAAAAHGQMLIITLTDGRSYCGDHEGAPRGDGSGKIHSWYQTGYKTNFKPYITEIVRKYKNSPAIGMWEIINEPDDAGDINVLKAFLDDCAATIKAEDPNHLVSSGSWAEYAYGGQANFQLIHSGQNIDVGSLHEYDYDYKNSKVIVSNHYKPCLAAMNNLNKPLIIGEVGIKASLTGDCLSTLTERKDAMKQKFDAYIPASSGVLVWNWSPDLMTKCAHDCKPADPIMPMVANYILP